MNIPWTLEPGHMEMPSDFASRLSARACRDDFAGFCRDFDLDRQGLVDGKQAAVAQLAGLAEVDPKPIALEAFSRIDQQQKRYVHKGHQFIAQNLSRDRVRACPACLEDDLARHAFRLAARPYRRSTWLIEHVRTCRVHGIALVAVGSSSKMAGMHDTSQVLASIIPRVGGLVRTAARRMPSGFENYIMGRLDGSAPLTPWVDALSIHAVMRLSAMVGGAAVFGPRVAIDSLEDTLRWETEAIGFEILAEGEQSILKFLDRLQSSFLDGHVRQGPHPLFGHLYEWLAHQTDDPAYDPMRELMRRHATETLPIGPEHRVFGREIPSRRLHSIRSASQQHDLHPKTTRGLLRDLGLIGASTDGLPDDRVVFDASKGDAFLSEVAGTMSQAAAARYLSIPQSQFILLVKAGSVVPWVAGGKGQRNHLFRKADLDAFRDRLLEAVNAVHAGEDGLVEVPTAAKRACCSLAEIVELISHRTLRSVGRSDGGRGLAALLVDVDEVRSHVAGEDLGGLTLRQVEKELHTSTRAVKCLVEGGLIPIEVVKNPVRRQSQMIVRPAALADFRKRYVSLQSLASERGVGHLNLKRVLKERGILPVGDPALLHLTLYRRSDFG